MLLLSRRQKKKKKHNISKEIVKLAETLDKEANFQTEDVFPEMG